MANSRLVVPAFKNIMRKLLQLLIALILSAGILFGQWWYVPSPTNRLKGFTERDFHKFRNSERQRQIDLRNARIARAILQVYSCRGEDIPFYIARYIRDTPLSPRVVAAVIIAESSCNPNALSPTGSVGLMQINRIWKTRRDLRNPEDNIRMGTSILARYLQETGSTREALRRYYGIMDGCDEYAEKVLTIARGEKQ